MAARKEQLIKVEDYSCVLPSKKGNGTLRREVWVDKKGQVARYNLAFINHSIHAEDNGRVVGYDNAHGYHHRHYLGKVTPIEFESYAKVEEMFEADWMGFKK